MMRTNYIATFISHSRAGSYDYEQGRKHGHVAIWHDNQLWLYKVTTYNKQGLKDFKNWVRSTFNNDDADYRLSGKWPSYRMDIYK
jgi:hypothetical protein